MTGGQAKSFSPDCGGGCCARGSLRRRLSGWTRPQGQDAGRPCEAGWQCEVVRIGRKSSLGGVARSFSRHKWDLVVKNSGTWASYRMPETDVTGIDFSISG